MAEIFSPQDILRVAINVEENGMNLYEKLAEAAKEDKIKEVWKYLQEQEEIHRKIFQDMLDNVGDYVVYEFTKGEYDAYLKAIASEYIITQDLIEKKVKELFNSDEEAIDFGIYIEKQSILTYSALKDYMQAAKQEILDKVIEEEKKHLSQLHMLKKSFQ